MTDERNEMPRARAVESAPEETPEDQRKRLLRQAYGKASQDLREKHRGDFEEFYRARAQEAGIDWKPRPSQDQVAAEQFDALVEQFPWLVDRLRHDAPEEGDDEEQMGT